MVIDGSGQIGISAKDVIDLAITDSHASDGEDGFQLEVEGTGNATVDVDDCTFQRIQRDGVDAIVEGTGGALLNLTVRNSEFLDNAGLGGVIVASGNTASARVTVRNNLFEDTVSTAITMVQAAENLVCLAIQDVGAPGNNVFNGNTAAGIRVREVVAGAIFQVEGLALGDQSTATMQAFLDANNTNNPPSLASPAGSVYTGVAAGSCRLPAATPLP